MQKEHGLLFYEEVHPKIKPTEYCEKPAQDYEPVGIEEESDHTKFKPRLMHF